MILSQYRGDLRWRNLTVKLNRSSPGLKDRLRLHQDFWPRRAWNSFDHGGFCAISCWLIRDVRTPNFWFYWPQQLVARSPLPIYDQAIPTVWKCDSRFMLNQGRGNLYKTPKLSTSTRFIHVLSADTNRMLGNKVRNQIWCAFLRLFWLAQLQVARW